MKFTATTITCNAGLMIGRLIRHIAPLFDKVIVIDGPSSDDGIQSNGDGCRLTGGTPHSTDGTPDIVRECEKEIGHKICLITSDKPWPGKTSKFNKALEITEPGYIWEFDYDEFYHRSHIWMMKEYLENHPEISAVEFWAYHFWGDAFHHTPIREGAWGNSPPWRRIFRYDGKSRWASHEPPRLNGANGALLSRDRTREMGIMLYHYGYTMEQQVAAKQTFYNLPHTLVDEFREWRQGKRQKELVEFHGQHPVHTEFMHEPRGPRFCVLTMHSESYAQMAAVTIYQNKREYCDRWGYDLNIETEVDKRYSTGTIHAGGFSWDRLRVALDKIRSGRYDWIYCVGCDTLITNMRLPLTSFIDDSVHFIIANDCNEWNADSFLIRCSEPAIQFIEHVLSLFDKYRMHHWVEQQAMIEARESHPGIFKVLPQRSLDSYNYDLYPVRGGRDGKDCAGNDGQWQPGDFLIHWAGLPNDVRMADIERVLPLIVR